MLANLFATSQGLLRNFFSRGVVIGQIDLIVDLNAVLKPLAKCYNPCQFRQVTGAMMECPVCKADNPEGNLFCGKCGAAFSPAIQAVDREVEKLLKEKFKDRGLVEFEVSDKLITRFMLLLKIAAWVFAPALTILGIAIAIIASLGFKTYNEATTTIRNAAAAAVTEVAGDGEERRGRDYKLISTSRAGYRYVCQISRASKNDCRGARSGEAGGRTCCRCS
jgi:hypothetical protein